MRFKSRLLLDIERNEPRHATSHLAHAVKLTVIERDEHRCRLCHRTRGLHVHHVDRQGELSPTPNHAITNLVTLCTRCHRLVHTTGVLLTMDVIREADERRGAEHVNFPRTASVNEHLMQPDRALGLLDF